VFVAGTVLVLAITACGGSGSSGPSSSPSPLGGPNVVRVVDPSGALGAAEVRAVSIAESTLGTASGALGLDGVTVTIRPDVANAIAGYGVGGFTPDGRTIDISIDPGFPGLEGVLEERLSTVVAHETHHAARWRGPGYGSTLLEALVSEGLADHFAVEHLGAPVPPWSEAYPADQTEAWLERARPEFDSRTYDHSGWFFGTAPGLPRWTGYTLGYRLVATYQAAHAGATAAELVNTPASAFRP